MIDSELLKSAARNAGLNVVGENDDGLLLYGEQDVWNPLKSTSDAFELALMLGISIDSTRIDLSTISVCCKAYRVATIRVTSNGSMDELMFNLRNAITWMAASVPFWPREIIFESPTRS